MAIDTLNKRISVLSTTTEILPAPSGSVTAGNRQTLLKTFSGILAGIAIATDKVYEKLLINISIGL